MRTPIGVCFEGHEYPRTEFPQPGCMECDAVLSHLTLRCTHDGCRKEFCETHVWRCTGCSAVMCGEHTEVVASEMYCATCAGMVRENARQMFEEMSRRRFWVIDPCLDCGGKLDDADPFQERGMTNEGYVCMGCGAISWKRKTGERWDDVRSILITIWEYTYEPGTKVPAKTAARADAPVTEEARQSA